jgi:hypothetical protein
MNIVENWRNRPRSLRAEYRRCDGCGALASVRRLLCTHCGADMSRASLARLPRTLPAIAFSHAHVVVETMDQTEGRRPVMLLRASGDQLLALQLCESDAGWGQRLVGEPLEVVLRKGPNVSPNEPIVYGRKVAASAGTRARLKRNEVKSK